MLVCISIIVVVRRSGWPFLLFGWTWFVVTLVPVIGLVQVGMQAMADRYSYFPLIGVFVAAAWSLPDLKTRHARLALGLACAAVALVAALGARVQTSYWRDSQTLFRHAVAVTHDNATALRNLGIAYVEDRDYGRGIAALRESLRIVPGDAWAWMNLGIALSMAGDQAGADRAFQDALRLRPDDADVLYNVGMFAATQRNVMMAHAIHARLALVNPTLADEFAGRAGLR
jgi:tetratricopeptide (TPR) repeat protein